MSNQPTARVLLTIETSRDLGDLIRHYAVDKAVARDGLSIIAKDVPDPAPEWRPGDVVEVTNGMTPTVMLRRDDGTWACQDANCEDTKWHVDEMLAGDWGRGDVTVLVRDGKPVVRE